LGRCAFEDEIAEDGGVSRGRDAARSDKETEGRIDDATSITVGVDAGTKEKLLCVQILWRWMARGWRLEVIVFICGKKIGGGGAVSWETGLWKAIFGLLGRSVSLFC